MRRAVSIFGLFLTFILMSGFASAQSLSVGVMLWRGETPADRAFIEELRAHDPDISIEEFDAQQNIRNAVKTITLTWQDKLPSMDYIFTFGSKNSIKIRDTLRAVNYAGTQVALANADELSEAHRLRFQSKEKLLLGQTALPDQAIFKALSNIINIKNLGIPYNLHEPQNLDFIDSMKRSGAQYHIKITPIRTKPDTETLKKQLERALGRSETIDALYYPLDSFLISNSDKLMAVHHKTDVISIGSSERFVQAGMALGVVTDYKRLGQMLARQVMALEVGENMLKMPILRNQQGRLMANQTTLKKHHPEILKKLPPETLLID